MRPTKYSPQLVEEICKYVEEGNSHKDAALLAGIGEETFYKWHRKGNRHYHAEFAERLKMAEARQKRRNMLIIQQAAIGNPKKNISGLWTAAAWMLERKYPQEFSEKRILEHTGPGGGPIKTQELPVPELPPAMMKRLAAMVIPEANGSSNGHNGDALAGPRI